MNMISKVAPDGEAQRLRVKFRDRPLWQRAAIAGTPIVALVAAVTLWTSDPSPAAAPPTPQVTVAAPIERSVSLWDDYIGRFEASRTVEVRPRVSGQIIGIHFRDGEIVRKGQLLFTIDPRPFAAALAEARAGVATARSELALAQLNLGRAQRLLEADAVSQAKSTARAQVRTSQAAACRGAGARSAARARRRIHRRSARRSRGRISDRRDRCRQSRRRRRRRRRHPADHDQRARPDLFHLRRLRSAVPQGAARAAAGRGRRRSRSGCRTRADYRWNGPARLHRQRPRSALGHDPRPRRAAPIPDMFLTPGMFGNMRLPSGGTAQRAAGARRRGADRPGAQDRAGRRHGRHGRRASRSSSARWSTACASSAPASTPTDRVVIDGTSRSAMPGAQGAAPRAGRIARRAGEAPPRRARPGAASPAQATLARR